MSSHTRSFPHFHGTVVTPSGLFPSDLCRPRGSRLEGTWAEVSPLNDLVYCPVTLMSPFTHSVLHNGDMSEVRKQGHPDVDLPQSSHCRHRV